MCSDTREYTEDGPGMDTGHESHDASPSTTLTLSTTVYGQTPVPKNKQAWKTMLAQIIKQATMTTSAGTNCRNIHTHTYMPPSHDRLCSCSPTTLQVYKVGLWMHQQAHRPAPVAAATAALIFTTSPMGSPISRRCRSLSSCSAAISTCCCSSNWTYCSNPTLASSCATDTFRCCCQAGTAKPGAGCHCCSCSGGSCGCDCCRCRCCSCRTGCWADRAEGRGCEPGECSSDCLLRRLGGS